MGRRRPGRITVALAVAAAALAAGALGPAPPAAAEPVLGVDVGAAGTYVAGRGVPVRVTIRADRLVSGTVRVSSEGVNRRGGAVEVPVEVTGGTTKEVVVALPTARPPGGQSDLRTEVRVQLRDGDTLVAEQTASAVYEARTEAVGVLPGMAAVGRLPDTVPFPLDTGTATLHALDAVVLDAGADALGPYATLVALPADLDALSPGARVGLLGWLESGGHLAVDSDGGPVPVLPEAWQPHDGRVAAGAGEVRSTGGAASAGRWSEVVELTAAGNVAPIERQMTSANLVDSLGWDARFRLPDIGVLVAVLLVYILLVGPVLFVVLRRIGRRTMAWALVPATAVLFTGGFTLSGLRMRDELSSSHATVIEVGPAGARASTSALVGSIDGGARVVRLPAGWSPRSAQEPNGGWSPTRAPAFADLTAEPGATVAHLALSAGEFRLVEGRGPVEGYADAVTIEATTDGRTIDGTVTNRLPVALAQVTVMAANATAMVPRVDAGARVPFSVAVPLADRTPGNVVPEVDWWPITREEMRYGGGMYAYSVSGAAVGPGTSAPVVTAPRPPPRSPADSPVNVALWTSFAGERPETLRAPGLVSVVGWTDALPAPLAVDGEGPVRRGRTAFVARGGIAPASLDTLGVRMEPVRVADGKPPAPGQPVARVAEIMGLGTTYRVILPAAVGGAPLDPAAVVLHVPPDIHRIAIASTRGWKVTPEQGQPITYRLGAEDVVDGVVYLRVGLGDQLHQGPGTNSGPYEGWRFTLATAGDGAGAPAVVP
jgi:hypothetical protein